LTGLYGGLDDLFEFGKIDLLQMFGRTAEWRRAVPGSVMPDLLEAEIFSTWAWGARGHAAATQVSALAWQLFEFRSEMAAAALEDAEQRASSNPLFFELSLHVGLDRGADVEALRAVFEGGRAKFPAYGPLYAQMLRILMPRWMGSYESVDELVSSVTNVRETRRDAAFYSRLYWIYSSLERDKIDIFTDGKADWPTMKSGFSRLVELHPDSDFILNGFAKFACIAKDRDQYVTLRTRITHHISSVAWSEEVTLDSCDKAYPSGPAASPG